MKLSFTLYFFCIGVAINGLIEAVDRSESLKQKVDKIHVLVKETLAESSDEAGKDVIKFIDDMEISYNKINKKIIPEFKNLKSHSTVYNVVQQAFDDINAGAEDLAKLFKRLDTEIDEKYNAIKDKTSPKDQILLQAILTIRALMSASIFREFDVITAQIRGAKLKNTDKTVTLADASYDKAYNDLNSALKFSLNRINSLKDKSDEDVLKHKNLLDLMIKIFEGRFNQMKDVGKSDFKATTFDSIKDKLKILQNNVNDKLTITEMLLGTTPYTGPVDKPSLESFKQQLSDILNGIKETLSSLGSNE